LICYLLIIRGTYLFGFIACGLFILNFKWVLHYHNLKVEAYESNRTLYEVITDHYNK